MSVVRDFVKLKMPTVQGNCRNKVQLSFAGIAHYQGVLDPTTLTGETTWIGILHLIQNDLIVSAYDPLFTMHNNFVREKIHKAVHLKKSVTIGGHGFPPSRE